ncbi:MAG: diguanylate cyclase [Thermodesulfobacteriota bacterium]|nr:diguanylate cyclase [Thermodesulfobacteriota bacterium]
MQFTNDIKSLNQELKNLFASAPIGICKIDIAGQMVSANPEAAWMLGYESSENLIELMSDIKSQMFVHQNTAEEFMFNLFEAEEVKSYKCQLIRKNGSLLWTRCYAKIILSDSGRINGFYLFIINIKDTVTAETKLKKANDKLKKLSTIDGLTQIANRRQFDEYCAMEYKRLTREKRILSIIMCDVDYFKLYNDTYGHQAGDECLKSIAKAIQVSVKRPSDLAARYGGEEFVVVLPNTDSTGAMHVAEYIRLAVKTLKIVHSKSTVDRYVTLSLGMASMIPIENSTNEILVDMADKALYKAKEQGRNRSIQFNKGTGRK